jgi:CheY-like chemotaxis protein
MSQLEETILVVDSDVIARTVIAGYLRDCGYVVIEADSGEEALTALQHPKFSIAVVLSDVELRGAMNGFGVARWVRENRPELEIILASALEKTAASAAEFCEDGPALGKPYHPQLVLERIRRLRALSKPE